MKLTILFDNIPYDDRLTPLWGFSCLVEREGYEPFLFDTGSNGRVLLSNARILGIDLSEIESLILSHPHWDHVGGVDSVLELAPDVRLFVPASLSPRWIADLKRLSGGVTVVSEEPRPLFDGVLSTGIMSEAGEQSILIESPEGPILLTGCAHAGIVSIAARVTELAGQPLALAMGGFHLFAKESWEIEEVIEGLAALGVRRVCPTHCSGERAIAMFAEAYGADCIRGGVGAVIEISEE